LKEEAQDRTLWRTVWKRLWTCRKTDYYLTWTGAAGNSSPCPSLTQWIAAWYVGTVTPINRVRKIKILTIEF
jgi:hypothetical protein